MHLLRYNTTSWADGQVENQMDRLNCENNIVLCMLVHGDT